jgi:hypothetical protein
MKSTSEILEAALKTERARADQYGDASVKSAEIMAKLFPNGIHLGTPEEHRRFFMLRMIVAKLARYANSMSSDTPHLDSAHDIIVYAAMLEAMG